MEIETLMDQCLDWVVEGLDFDSIKSKIDRMKLEKEIRNLVLQRVDEMIFHYQLDQQRRSRALGQMIMGGVLLAFPLLIAFLAYDPASKITYLWYGAALLGAWQLKEGYKKYRQPFEPPENFGYKRRKFQRF
jgi:uncharacterized membrane protein